MSPNFYKFLFLFLLIFQVSGCFRFVKLDSGKNFPRAHNNVVTHHKVKPGETLYSIAFEYGRDHRDVARWNRIPRPYTIFPNQKLRIIPIRSDAKRSSEQTVNRTKQVEIRKTTTRRSVNIEPKTRYVSNANLKWAWPTKGKIISTFSLRDPGRRGIDISGRKGQAINAAATGKVVYKGNGLRGYGNLIIIKHNETYFSAYAHTENVVVKENQKVKLGQRIADMGNTSSEKTKLHFEIRRNGKPVNPLRSLPKRR